MTQPVQEPTQGRVDQQQSWTNRQLLRRPAQAGTFPLGSYLQAFGVQYRGNQFQVLTSNNNYPGGNGASWYDGAWQWIDDPTCPFDGVALESSTDGDWFPFPLGNLGPQGTGYGVSFWFYGDTTGASIDLEFATVSIDENTGTAGAFGSLTSVLGPDDFESFGATPPGWYNNGNLDPDHGYRFDLSDGAAGWAIGNAIINATTFTLEDPDGTPLTADALAGDPDWQESSEFLAGGGPSLWWWMRMKIAPGGNAGTLCRVGQVWLHRLNGVGNFVGG